jgi:hypothetical protein
MLFAFAHLVGPVGFLPAPPCYRIVGPAATCPRSSSARLLAPAIPPAAAAASMDSALDAMDLAALDLDDGGEKIWRPKRGPDGRLEPVLTLPGDSLETTRPMGVITVTSTAAVLGVVAHAFASSSNPLWPLLSVMLGALLGEMFSGAFHWATDNYGSLQTPVVGFACAAFQGHHLAPWTISHRSVWNNVHKIATATLPLILAALVLLPPSGAALVATLFYSQALAQEFHRWTHTPPSTLAPWQRQLQRAGLALPLQEHLAHHRPPFDKHYCILFGGLNRILDSEPVLLWRRLEALVFRWNGQEPNSWLDPKVKERALGRSRRVEG